MASVGNKKPVNNAFITAAVHTAQLLGKPLCQYGAGCYREQPEHFAELRHPHREALPMGTAPMGLMGPAGYAVMPAVPAAAVSVDQQAERQARKAKERAEHAKLLSPYIAIDAQKEGWEHRTESKHGRALRALLTQAFTSSHQPHPSPAVCEPTTRRKATAAARRAAADVSGLLAHNTFDPNVVSIVLQYVEEQPCLHATFTPELELAVHSLSPLVSKWGGVPYLHTGESWPTCGQCNKPLSFLFQIRQGDYPTILQHAYSAQPQRQSAAHPTEQTHPHAQHNGGKKRARALDEETDEPADDEEMKQRSEEKEEATEMTAEERAGVLSRRDDMLFQFFLCAKCKPQYQYSALPGQDRTAKKETAASLIRLIDPSLRPPIAGLAVEGKPVCDEQRLVGWEEHEDYPGGDEMDLVMERLIESMNATEAAPSSACPLPPDSKTLRAASESLSEQPHECDRMGGFPYWSEGSVAQHCHRVPVLSPCIAALTVDCSLLCAGCACRDNGNFYGGCGVAGCAEQRLRFFGETWQLQFGEGSSGVICQCPTHKHFFDFSWSCD